jgi:hypothetical protein
MDDVGVLSSVALPVPVDRDAWKERFGKQFRRADAYVQAAQLGAALTFEQAELPASPEALGDDLMVVFGTGLANLAAIVPLIEAIHHPTAPRCSPLAFARSVANAGAFFVAQAFGLSGPNTTVSQEELSFEAAMQEAWLALRLGEVQYALVAGVDVRYADDAAQRVRIGADDIDGEIAGGAAFVLLGPGGTVRLADVHIGALGSIEALRSEAPATTEFVRGWRAGGLDLPGRIEHRLSPTASGLAFVEALGRARERGSGARVVHLQQHRDGGWGRLVAEVR